MPAAGQYKMTAILRATSCAQDLGVQQGAVAPDDGPWILQREPPLLSRDPLTLALVPGTSDPLRFQQKKSLVIDQCAFSPTITVEGCGSAWTFLVTWDDGNSFCPEMKCERSWSVELQNP